MSNSDDAPTPARRTASTRRSRAAAAAASAATLSPAASSTEPSEPTPSSSSAAATPTPASTLSQPQQPPSLVTREQINEILHQLLDVPRRSAPATVAHTAPNTFLRKIPLHNEPGGPIGAPASPFVLQTTWSPALQSADPLASVELLLINCATGVAHVGHITYTIMQQSAARLEIDAAEYLAEMRLMLTGCEPEPLTVDTCPAWPQQQYLDELEARQRTHLFELTPTMHTQRERAVSAEQQSTTASQEQPNTTTTTMTATSHSSSSSSSGPPFLTLTWRKRVTERVTVVYGAVLLQPHPHASAAELLAAAVDRMESRALEQRRQRCESAALLRNQSMLAAEFERCLAVRMENEQGMLRRFMALLSAKKTRIVELQQMLRTGQAEYDEEVARMNGEAWTETAAEAAAVATSLQADEADEGDDVAADVAAVLSDMENSVAAADASGRSAVVVGGGGDGNGGGGKDDANSNDSDDSVFTETQGGPATAEEARAAAKRAKFSMMRVADADDDDDDKESQHGEVGGSQRKFCGIGSGACDSGSSGGGGGRDSPLNASAVDRQLPQLAALLPRRLAAVVAEASRSKTRRTLSGGVHLEQPPSSPAQGPLADDDDSVESSAVEDAVDVDGSDGGGGDSNSLAYDCDTEPMADDS